MSEELTFEEIGRRLKEAREESGFTQYDVEELIGINRVTLSNIERGQNRVDTLTLKKLSELYGYSISYFLEEPESHQKLEIAFRDRELSEEENEAVNWAKKILFNYKDLKDVKEGG